MTEPRSESAGTRRRGAELVLLAIFAVLGLLVLEAAVRLLAPQIGWRPFPDPALGWSTREYQGFDPAAEDPKRGLRLLFLGDSYLAGSAVRSLDERFPARIQESLGDGSQVRILASGGWGTDQQYLAFLQKGRAWAPDLVVVAFCANNDLADIVSNRHPTAKRKPYFVLAESNELRFRDASGAPASPPDAPAEAPPSMSSYLWDLVRFRAGAVLAGSGPEEGEVETPPHGRRNDSGALLAEVVSLSPRLSWVPQEGANHVSAYIQEDFPANDHQWRLFEAILVELREAVSAIGARLAVMVLPTTLAPRDLRFVVGSDLRFEFSTPRGPFTFRPSAPRERLGEIAERLGVIFVDPTPAFLSRVRRDDLADVVWPTRDRHFAQVGHEILAEIVLRQLREKGLVPRAAE